MCPQLTQNSLLKQAIIRYTADMSWKKTDQLVQKRMRQHGLMPIIIGTQICQEAERLLPKHFIAISFNKGTLTLQITPAQAMPLKLKEGWLLTELKAFCESHKLPIVKKLRLTFSEEPGILESHLQ